MAEETRRKPPLINLHVNYQQLSSTKRTWGKIFWTAISGLITLYFFKLLGSKTLLLTSEQITQILLYTWPSIISIISSIILAILVIRVKKYRKYFGIGLLASFILSAIFLRFLIIQFYIPTFPSGLGLSIIYTAMGLISTIVMSIKVIIPRVRLPIDANIDEPTTENIFSRLSQKWRIIIAIGFFIFSFLYIRFTGTVFVDSPNFGVFDFLYQNSILSALAGIIETQFFFVVLQATIHNIAFSLLHNSFLATVVGILLITLIFFQFHLTVYQYLQSFWLSVILFGFFNAINQVIFRDESIDNAWHFGNNLFKNIFNVQKFAVFVVF